MLYLLRYIVRFEIMMDFFRVSFGGYRLMKVRFYSSLILKYFKDFILIDNIMLFFINFIIRLFMIILILFEILLIKFCRYLGGSFLFFCCFFGFCFVWNDCDFFNFGVWELILFSYVVFRSFSIYFIVLMVIIIGLDFNFVYGICIFSLWMWLFLKIIGSWMVFLMIFNLRLRLFRIVFFFYRDSWKFLCRSFIYLFK